MESEKIFENGENQTARLTPEEKWELFLKGLNGFTDDFFQDGREPDTPEER